MPLGAGVPLERGRRRGVPPLKRRHFAFIGSNNVKMIADRYIHAAYHNKHWWQAFWIYQHRWPEWPWTLKILILSDFLAIFGCKRVNYDEIDGHRLRLPANRNCYRLSRVSWALLKLLVNIPEATNIGNLAQLLPPLGIDREYIRNGKYCISTCENDVPSTFELDAIDANHSCCRSF